MKHWCKKTLKKSVPFATTSLLLFCSAAGQSFRQNTIIAENQVDSAYALRSDDNKPDPPDAPSAVYSTSKAHGAISTPTVMLAQENWRPLTTKEKFIAFREDMLSPFTHMSLLAGAKFSQATNDRPYLGPGFAGFTKRYGLDTADTSNNDFVQGSLLPWLFHEDPRYIPMDSGTKKRRVLYALSRVIITRKDSGREGFNRSKVLGSFASSAISNLYYPSDRNRDFGSTMSRAGIGIGSDAALNLAKEFWPDVAHKMKLKVWLSNLVERSLRSGLKQD